MGIFLWDSHGTFPQVSVLQNTAQAVSNTDESAAIVERVEPKHDSAQCLH